MSSIRSTSQLPFENRVDALCREAQECCKELKPYPFLTNDWRPEVRPSERYWVSHPKLPRHFPLAVEQATARSVRASQRLEIAILSAAGSLVGAALDVLFLGTKFKLVGGTLLGSACGAAVPILVMAGIGYLAMQAAEAAQTANALQQAAGCLEEANKAWWHLAVLPDVLANPGSLKLVGRAKQQQERAAATHAHSSPREVTLHRTQVLNGPCDVVMGQRFGSWNVGVASIQGRREQMEDRFSVKTFAHGTMAAVLDGHGGAGVSDRGKDLIPEMLANALEGLTDAERRDPNVVRRTIKDTFHLKDLEQRWEAEPCIQNELLFQASGRFEGSTLVMAIQMEGRTYIVNLGDSRALAIAPFGRAIRVSEDHKPDDPREQRRVLRRGYEIVPTRPNNVPRLMGHVAMSRVLGDRCVAEEAGRRPGVTCLEHHGPLVLATDGLFDHGLTDAEVGRATLAAAVDGLGDAHAAAGLAYDLVSAAYDVGSHDNITAMVINWPGSV